MKALHLNKMLLGILLFPASIMAQTYTYTIKVEDTYTYGKQEVKAEKLINGNYLIENQTPGTKRVTNWYQIKSKTRLNQTQCLELIRQGKATRIQDPNKKKFQPTMDPNVTMGEREDNIWDRDIYMNDDCYEDHDLWDFLSD